MHLRHSARRSTRIHSSQGLTVLPLPPRLHDPTLQDRHIRPNGHDDRLMDRRSTTIEQNFT